MVERALDIEAEAVQIFPSSSRRWRPYAYTPQDLMAFGQTLREADLPLFVHSIYLINLASPDPEVRRSSAAALAYALYFGTLTGARAIVSHVGSHKGQGFDAGLERVAPAVAEARDLAQESLWAARRTLARAEVPAGAGEEGASTAGMLLTDSLPPLLLESSAGSKNTMGKNPAELAILLEELKGLAAGVCLDTAHLYAAGIPLHTESGLEELLALVDGLMGLERVQLLHLNDCRTAFASLHDQHSNLGEGNIGEEGLRRVVMHPALRRVPFVLEVPGIDGNGPDRENLRRASVFRQG